MFRCLPFLALLATASTAAMEVLNERAVAVTAQRTGVPPDRVRQAAGTGCDSDMSSMNLCAEYQFIAADQRMNDVYKRLLITYSTRTTSLLVKSQRRWVSYRDGACAFESSGLEGGTAYGYSQLQCLRDKTTARVNELEIYENCTQGGCPGPRR